MKERRERTMGDFTAEPAQDVDPLDYATRERFNAERHPERTVDGDDPWSMDLFEDLPGMWDAADLAWGWADTEGER